jgi:hypothetical protein
MAAVSWLFAVLLAGAVGVLVLAEWHRIADRLGFDARSRRGRARRKARFQVVRTEQDEFAASVQRDLDRLPTVEEQNRRR